MTQRKIRGVPYYTEREGWFGADFGIYTIAGLRLGYASPNAGRHDSHSYTVVATGANWPGPAETTTLGHARNLGEAALVLAKAKRRADNLGGSA